ncbi:hypothetical protein E5K02_22765 [Hymenobacter metallicola]|uniref:Uncharacterized protein n=1 Tax=Hymenobacter metallicola TaxID=2563114 RepID=A0A4Z0Q0C4_9BACT|nr:hypothetical protein E5K02_22765 [Hymenobacter metallicola]
MLYTPPDKRTLISSNSRSDRALRNEKRSSLTESAGQQLFMTHPLPETRLQGGNCHGGPNTSRDMLRNNGLDSFLRDVGRKAVTRHAQDRAVFRAPSLRDIALMGSYMHDGRFKPLDEVLNHYSEHVQPSAMFSPCSCRFPTRPVA